MCRNMFHFESFMYKAVSRQLFTGVAHLQTFHWSLRFLFEDVRKQNHDDKCNICNSLLLTVVVLPCVRCLFLFVCFRNETKLKLWIFSTKAKHDCLVFSGNKRQREENTVSLTHNKILYVNVSITCSVEISSCSNKGFMGDNIK